MEPESSPEVTDGELMLCNTLIIDPEQRLAYLRALGEVLPQARALPGCLLLEVGERADSPGTFILTERWRSAREFLGYLSLPFYRDYLEASERMYAAPRDAVILTAVGPG
jgi:quinol monooxygenase YgiN